MDVVNWLQIVVLSVVQGLTEFLPVSSSAHLILVPVLTQWQDQGLVFDVAVHVGTLLAVCGYFRQTLGDITTAFWQQLRYQQSSEDARLAWAVILGTIPVGLAGLLGKDLIELYLRSPVVIALSTIGFGLLLWWADQRAQLVRDRLRWRDVLFIGGGQALALIPGTSRSGITMTIGLMCGLTRQAAAKFSFLLSIPVIALAGGLMLLDLVETPQPVHWPAIGLAILLSFASAYGCIHVFLQLLDRVGMTPFVIYRLVLGVILLGWFL